MDKIIALPLVQLYEINLSLNRVVAVADLVLSYAVANNEAHPNLAPGTLLNAMQIIQKELDVIREALKLAQGSSQEKVVGASEPRLCTRPQVVPWGFVFAFRSSTSSILPASSNRLASGNISVMASSLAYLD